MTQLGSNALDVSGSVTSPCPEKMVMGLAVARPGPRTLGCLL